jgi:hypothetical protein
LWVIEDDISRELAPGVTPMLAALDGTRLRSSISSIELECCRRARQRLGRHHERGRVMAPVSFPFGS